MLSAAQLARMRKTQEMNLPSICTIRRSTVIDDGMGGQTASWADVVTVACRIGVAGTGVDRKVADRQENDNTLPITVPAGTDVRNTDRVTCGNRTFEVVSVSAHDYETARQVRVTEIL